MKPAIKFGTDGWRAVIADQFTFDNVRTVAQAIADYWNESGNGPGRYDASGQLVRGHENQLPR